MQRPNTVIGLNAKECAKVLALANHVVEEMTGNPNFPGPTTPTLTDVSTAATALSLSISARGNVHSHGTSLDVIDMHSKSLALLLLLKALASYVETQAIVIAGTDYNLAASIIASSGFSLKGASNPQEKLWAVQDFQVAFDRSLNINEVKLKWSPPGNVTSKSKSNIKLYKIYKGITPAIFSTAAYYASTSKLSWQDVNNTGGPQTWAYWIVPVANGNDGDGAVSSPVVVTVYSM